MEDADQNASNVNILALLFLVAMIFVILKSSRRNAVGALLAMAAFIPLGQEINVFGLHFYFLRILILVGAGRLFLKHEAAGFKLTVLDKLVVAWAVVTLICGLLRDPSLEIFGALYNNLGVYFIFRLLMEDSEDVKDYLKILAVLGVVVGVCMTWEVMTRRNPFSIFGGVPAITVQRGDRFRCQGAFRQPILAGTFGATLFPLMVGLWQQPGRGKWLAVLGTVFSLVITVVSASSGPLMTFVAAIIGFALWPLRQRMHLFRRGIVAVLIGFMLVMNAPVWFLIAKLSDLVGGGGWHRSWLIEQFLTHISQWCCFGTSYTANWAPGGEVMPNNPNMMDITNHYVTQGIQGGALGLALFIASVVVCFKIVGRAVWARSDWSYEPKLAWALGVSLACHCTAFISVSYFDQIQVFWFWLLAAIAAIPAQAGRKAAAETALREAAGDFGENCAAVGPGAQ